MKKANAVCGLLAFPIGKKIEDTPEGIRTRSQEYKQELVKRVEFKRYHTRIGRENIKRWLETDYFYFMKESDSFSVIL